MSQQCALLVEALAKKTSLNAEAMKLRTGEIRFSAGEQGFEPQLSDPESDVLPLDDSPSMLWNEHNVAKYKVATPPLQFDGVRRCG